MKPLPCLACGAFLAALLSAQDVTTAGPKLRLAEKTAVPLRFEVPLSSASSHAGDRVKFEVTSDVKGGEEVLISKGSRAWGVVADATPRGRLDRDGKLNIRVDTVCLVDGTSAPLRAVADPGETALKAPTEGQSLAEGVLAFPAAPILLFVYGKEISIPAGKEIAAYINKDVFVVPASVKAPVACDPAASTEISAAAAVPVSGATIFVKTQPSGAEITVDGKFFGNTPSTLRLPPGDHQFSLKARGYTDWDRSLTLTPGGEVTISAALDPLK